MTNPKISVFMAAYNAEKYIKESIDSILQQSFTDFELIVLNDGSTDKTVEIVNSISDSRIRLVDNDKNRGLFYTRNRVKDTANGEYIAILDSDDIAHKDRLAIQYNFFEKNPDMALCGGHAEVIDSLGVPTGVNYFVPTDNTIKMFMLFGNPYINSSVMFKKAVFDELGGYREYAPAEDFDLFQRISEKHPISNVDFTLVKYRIHDTNTSVIAANNKKSSELKILSNLQNNLKLHPTEKSLSAHFDIFSREINPNLYHEYLELLVDLRNANSKIKVYNVDVFNQFIFNKWFEIITSHKKNKKVISLLFNKKIYSSKYATPKQIRKSVKLNLKSLFN